MLVKVNRSYQENSNEPYHEGKEDITSLSQNVVTPTYPETSPGRLAKWPSGQAVHVI